jgi:hypothetical protein
VRRQAVSYDHYDYGGPAIDSARYYLDGAPADHDPSDDGATLIRSVVATDFLDCRVSVHYYYTALAAIDVAVAPVAAAFHPDAATNSGAAWADNYDAWRALNATD